MDLEEYSTAADIPHREQQLIVRQPIDESLSSSSNHNLVLRPRQYTLSQYLNNASGNMYLEHEEVCKRIGYFLLLVVCVLVGIGLVFAQPGTGMKMKWRRSIRKMVSRRKH